MMARVAEELAGTFWVPGEEQRASVGSVTIDDAAFHLMTTSSIAAEKSRKVTPLPAGGGSRIAPTNDPADVVADFLPRIVQGRLEDGGVVTLLDAKLSASEFIWPHQSFLCHRLIVGCHVDATDVAFDATRFSLPSEHLWRGVIRDAEAEISAAGSEGTLSAHVESQRLWIVYQPSRPMTVTEYEFSVWSPCAALLSLWTNREVRPKDVELRSRDFGDVWSPLRRPTKDGGQSLHEADCLLSPIHVSVRDIHQWLQRASSLGPIPFMVQGTKGTLQSDVLGFATALEGLHQRLYPKRRPLEGLPPSSVRKVKDAAVDAGVKRAVELGWSNMPLIKKRFADVLSFFDSMTYAQRVTDLAREAASVAPGLLGPNLQDWVTQMKKERNNQSHQSLNTNRFRETEVDRYIQLNTSARWVLHLCILLSLGVSKESLASALRRHRRFLFDLANIDACLHGWSGSSLATFREAVPAACQSAETEVFIASKGT